MSPCTAWPQCQQSFPGADVFHDLSIAYVALTQESKRKKMALHILCHDPGV